VLVQIDYKAEAKQLMRPARAHQSFLRVYSRAARAWGAHLASQSCRPYRLEGGCRRDRGVGYHRDRGLPDTCPKSSEVDPVVALRCE
jgi:hypothetical protein